MRSKGVKMPVAVNNRRLFTKSAFKIALECPAQLYYYHEPQEYANQNQTDEFLQALAEGGFQVGELAKIYCGVDEGCDLANMSGYEQPVARTSELLKRDRVTIAEAAFRFGNLFIRADVVRKDGNRIDLIEVKAKSWNPADAFLRGGRNGAEVPTEIRMYVYDVAFQRYVLENALREMGIDATIHAYLMLADKSKVADVAGINQCFRIRKDGGRAHVELMPGAFGLKDHAHVLTAFDVDEVCRMIIGGQTAERQRLMGGQDFVDFVTEKAKWYCNHERHYCDLSTTCYKCPFYATPETPGMKDGYDECWIKKAHFTTEDLRRPLLEDLWGGGNTHQRGQLFEKGKYRLEDISADDIGTPRSASTRPGLDYCQRKLLQVGMTTNRLGLLGKLVRNIQPDGSYLDVEGLRQEMSNWVFPLHMIDFETTAVALPFYAKMHPYEQVAFQFSHHVIEKDGEGYRIRHAGQYINTERGKFPNFEFLRALKRELDQDAGTVSRYAAHENSILNAIRVQLLASDESDKNELIAFIETITHRKEGQDVIAGSRDMVDLCDVVKRFFYHPRMKGSNSIKAVLPAVLNASAFLQEKYAQRIYGREIPSKNIPADSPVAWISRAEDGTVADPYKKLPDVTAYLPDGLLQDRNDEDASDSGITVNNGGAALTAYSMLQFCGREMVEPLKQALLRYCELDTMAIVFIWEYFNKACDAAV